MGGMTDETKSQRWKRLMSKRAAVIEEALRKIGNLTNTSAYDYDEQLVELAFGRIHKEVDKTKELFLATLAKRKR
jgi:hypothetical protein